MEHVRILQLVEQIIHSSEVMTTRYLILFHQSYDYHSCIFLLMEQYPEYPYHEYIEFLPCINAIRCSLSHSNCMNEFLDFIHIEVDQELQIGARSLLPAPGKPINQLDSSQRIPWGLTAIQAPRLWPKSKGQGVRIGIVDTGVDFTHPDINPSLNRGINLLNRHHLPIDENGHGTHIAGTLVASNPVSGIRGIAPKATIYPIKAFDRDGAAYVSDIILAIQWCIVNHMNIINMSFGMSSYSPALHNAVKSAYAEEIVIVASAGNQGKRDAIDYPARFPQTIAVGATNKVNRIAAFSNQGGHVDVYAPGESIYSTWPQGQYNELSGTSMATAHVSGVIALMLAKKPKLTVIRIKNILSASSVSFTYLNKKLLSKKGRLHAVRAWAHMYRQNKLRKKITATKAKRTSVS